MESWPILLENFSLAKNRTVLPTVNFVSGVPLPMNFNLNLNIIFSFLILNVVYTRDGTVLFEEGDGPCIFKHSTSKEGVRERDEEKEEEGRGARN